MKSALASIRNEHQTISSAVTTLQHLAQSGTESGQEHDLPLLADMVDYLDMFLGRVHYLRDAHLFRALGSKVSSLGATLDRLERGYRPGYEFAGLRQRLTETRAALDDLSAEHKQSLELIRNLREALACYRTGEHRCKGDFLTGVEAFAHLHKEHLRKEEFIVLPVAETVFSADDWAEVSAACQAERDPFVDEALERLSGKLANSLRAFSSA